MKEGHLKKTAVVLSGCGHLDGSEIREAVGVLWALSAKGTEVQCFAPHSDQTSVLNHLTREAKAETRNQLEEAARIARGKILPLSELKSIDDYNALIIPGGSGAAKNLSTFATQGAAGKVIPDLQRVLESFYTARKPIGAVCIAPAILALSFPGKGLQLTVGAEGETSQEIEKLGHHHIVCQANECHVDGPNRIVTTPAYMYGDAPLAEIFSGILKLAHEVVQMAKVN